MSTAVLHKQKISGHINSDNEFVMQRSGRHYFKKYQGIGLSKDVLKQLASMQVKKIVLVYSTVNDGDQVYETTLHDMILIGIQYTNPIEEEDYQYILPLKKWKRTILNQQ